MQTIEHVFTGGRQVDSMQRAFTYTEDILDDIVKSYDVQRHEAPISWGHSGDTRKTPTDTLPAAGWVQNITRKGKNLYAEIEWSGAGQEEVKNKNYKKFSASFYRPDSSHNPKPGHWSLRHVALLGAEPPAVKGIKEMSFSEGEILGVDFVEINSGNVYRYNPFAKHQYPHQKEDLKYDNNRELFYYTEKRKRHHVIEYLDNGTKMIFDPEAKQYAAAGYKEFYVEDGGRYYCGDDKEYIDSFSVGEDLYTYDDRAKKYCSDSNGIKMYYDSAEPFNEVIKQEKPVEVEVEVSLEKEEEEQYYEGSNEPSQMTQFERMSNVLEQSTANPQDKVLAMMEKLSARLAEVEAENEKLQQVALAASKELRHKELMDFLNGIYSGGKLTEGIIPKETLASYMEKIETGDYAEFAEYGVSPIQPLKDILRKLPQVVSFEKTEQKHESDVDFAENTFSLDPDKHAKKLLKDGKYTSYEDAIKFVLYGV